MSEKYLLLQVFLFGGVLLLILSIPLILGRVKPNSIYGFRTSRTLGDPDLWYPVNRYSGFWLLAAGLGEILASLGLVGNPGLGLDAYAISVLIVFLILFCTGLAMTIRFKRRQESRR